jgi:hypothetical protein
VPLVFVTKDAGLINGTVSIRLNTVRTGDLTLGHGNWSYIVRDSLVLRVTHELEYGYPLLYFEQESFQPLLFRTRSIGLGRA